MTGMVIGTLILLLLALAPPAVWGAMAWRKRRFGLGSVFMVVAVEAAILGALRFWFM